MTTLPLRKTGPLVDRLPVLKEVHTHPPRALRSLAQIVEGDLCHRCGSCVGICPTGVLAVSEEGFPVVKNLSSCTDCDLCVKVCPGDEFSVPNLARQLFAKVPDIEDMHGHFEAAYIGYATDETIRRGSTSGGVITGLLVGMLEAGEIDGAIVVASDEKTLWKGKPIVARTREQLLSTMKSKYAIAPTNAIFDEILSHEGRYVLVGLPCQIHGYLKAAQLNKQLRERIVLSVGLFCHAAVEHEPMHQIFGGIDKAVRDNAVGFVSRIGKHPGTPHLQLKDGSYYPVYFPNASPGSYRPSSMEILNILYRLYTPPRCMTCYDSTAEFADIAVGDPWMAPPDPSIDFKAGYSFVLGRTSRGIKALTESAGGRALKLVSISADHARSSNTMMGHEKRGRAFRIIETRRRQGLPVPDYGAQIPSVKGKQLLHTEINIFTHIFCFLNWTRTKRTILALSLSSVGYRVLWLNYLRRTFRNWRRDRRFRKQRSSAIR